MNRIALLATVSLLAVCSAAAAENPTSDALAALEKKLHGNWCGGPAPCVGELLFKADGTYERRHYSPANINSGGTWSLRWDALPPTLTLNCKTSDDPDDVNKAFQYKLSRLDDATFAIAHENGPKPLIYSRDNASK